MTRYEQTAAAKQHTVAAAHATHQSLESTCERAVLTGSPLQSARSPASATAATDGRRQNVSVDVGDKLRDAFQVFDKDKDGFLSATDLRSVQIKTARYARPVVQLRKKQGERTGRTKC